MRIPYQLLLTGSALLAIGSAPAFSFSNHHNDVLREPSYIRVSDARDEDAEKFVDMMASDAITFLGNADLSDTDKEKHFSELLNRSFDMATIGRFALGKYWRLASPEQRDEYQKLFREMIVEVYSRRFGEYDGQNLDIRGSRAGQKDDVTVNSVIVPQGSGQDVKVDWRLRKKNGQYKVIDVVVEGVSMALTQRSDFSSVIQRGGGEVSVLIEHLREIK
ncbi:MAG: ABC transporter substrate-binding protein [Alphaproteobacteria bacterium]|nr:ABC transporter substrate-binding protein [Alphaproteobacteria bacterium]